MLITPPLRAALAERGVTAQFPGAFTLPDNSIFEGPCALRRMQTSHSLHMGAFSHVHSGFMFGVRIGRYVTIEDGVQIGRGSHPVAWGSTSPVFYMHHKHVFDTTLDEAAEFSVNAAGLPPAKITTIGNDVRIGAEALISQGVTIGDGAVIQPHTVVTKDVQPYTIIAGNPGIVVGSRFPLRVAARMLAVAWWRFAFWDLQGAPIDNPSAFLDHVQRAINAGLQPYAPEPVELRALAASLQETNTSP